MANHISDFKCRLRPASSTAILIGVKTVAHFNCLRLGLCVTLWLHCAPSLALTYYVDRQGNDRGQGTPRAPWQTVNPALTCQCLDKRIPDLQTLQTELIAWNISRDAAATKIN